MLVIRLLSLCLTVGAKTHELLAPTIPLALFALFQMKFAIITPSLITGSFAERSFFCISGIYDAFLHLCLLSAGALDVASRWISSSNGRG